MSKASLELGGGNWAAKDGNLLGYAVGDTSGKYLPREFTFSRGADIGATRVNKDGLIEKYRENLLLQSNQFDTTWSLNSASLTSGQAGYDGSNDAWELKATGDGVTHLARSSQGSLSVSGVSTFSVYVKAGNTDFVRINLLTSGSPNCNNYFDVANGSVGSSPSGSVAHSSITAAGNGFYRISLTHDGSGGSINEVRIQVAEADGDDIPATNSYIYIQDAQLERGLVATDYLESDDETGKAGVLDNLPRIDYTGGSASLLLEPQRKNELAHSEYFGGWSIKSGATETSNSIISPDGLQNASTISETTALTNYIGQNYTFTASTEYSYSVFVKNGTSSKMRLQVYDSSQYSTIDFDQSDSVTYSANLDSYDFVDYGNGWRRVIITFTTSAGAGSGYVQIYPDRNGNNEYLYAYGAQLEEGSYATSYIPNYGTALGVTRAAEGEDKDSLVTELPSELSGGYTLFMDFEVTGNEDPSTNYQDLFDFRFDNAVSKSAFRVETYNDSGEDSIRGFAYKQSSSSSAASVTAGDILMGSRVKLAATFDDSYGVKMFYNGSKIKDYAEVTAWEKVKFIGGAGSDGNARSRTLVNQILAYPTVLSETECENLTTI